MSSVVSSSNAGSRKASKSSSEIVVGFPIFRYDSRLAHTINHRGKAKKLADICLVLNVEDTHTVNYAVKKLERAGLVKAQRGGKEKALAVTPKGEAACRAYRDIREALLVQSVKSTGLDEAALSKVASTMRALSGHYDQAARSAATL